MKKGGWISVSEPWLMRCLCLWTGCLPQSLLLSMPWPPLLCHWHCYCHPLTNTLVQNMIGHICKENKLLTPVSAMPSTGQVLVNAVKLFKCCCKSTATAPIHKTKTGLGSMGLTAGRLIPGSRVLQGSKSLQGRAWATGHLERRKTR